MIVPIEHAAHDFPQIARRDHAKLFQGEIVRVDIFSLEDGLQLALDRFRGDATQLDDLIEEVIPFFRPALLLFLSWFLQLNLPNDFEY